MARPLRHATERRKKLFNEVPSRKGGKKTETRQFDERKLLVLTMLINYWQGELLIHYLDSQK